MKQYNIPSEDLLTKKYKVVDYEIHDTAQRYFSFYLHWRDFSIIVSFSPLIWISSNFTWFVEGKV